MCYLALELSLKTINYIGIDTGIRRAKSYYVFVVYTVLIAFFFFLTHILLPVLLVCVAGREDPFAAPNWASV